MVDELIETLTWMLKSMKSKREFGGPSPEVKKAIALLGKLRQYRGGEIISKLEKESILESIERLERALK